MKKKKKKHVPMAQTMPDDVVCVRGVRALDQVEFQGGYLW